MYRLIEINQNDVVLDAACGSCAFLVKSMCNMMKEAGGINTDRVKKIKSVQLYWIEFDREIFALACANMSLLKKQNSIYFLKYNCLIFPKQLCQLPNVQIYFFCILP